MFWAMGDTGGQAEDDATKDVGFEGLLSVALLEGLAPVGGRELEQAICGPAGHEAEQVAQICERFKLMQAAAGQDRDEDGVHFGTVVAAHEKPVLPADNLAAEVQLADVVVQRQATVVQEATQRHLLVACVADRLGNGRLVEDSFGFQLKRLRTWLHDRQVGRVTIKKRGSAVDVPQLRRQLRLDGDEEATIVLTRLQGRQSVIVVRRLH